MFVGAAMIIFICVLHARNSLITKYILIEGTKVSVTATPI